MAGHVVGTMSAPPLPSAPGQFPEAGVGATFASSNQRLQKSLRSLVNGVEGTPPWLRLGEVLGLAQTHRNQLGAAQTGLAPCFVFCSATDNELKDILDFFFAHCVKFQVSTCAKWKQIPFRSRWKILRVVFSCARSLLPVCGNVCCKLRFQHLVAAESPLLS